jgi:hypothetical protein
MEHDLSIQMLDEIRSNIYYVYLNMIWLWIEENASARENK